MIIVQSQTLLRACPWFKPPQVAPSWKGVVAAGFGSALLWGVSVATILHGMWALHASSQSDALNGVLWGFMLVATFSAFFTGISLAEECSDLRNRGDRAASWEVLTLARAVRLGQLAGTALVFFSPFMAFVFAKDAGHTRSPAAVLSIADTVVAAITVLVAVLGTASRLTDWARWSPSTSPPAAARFTEASAWLWRVGLTAAVFGVFFLAGHALLQNPGTPHPSVPAVRS